MTKKEREEMKKEINERYSLGRIKETVKINECPTCFELGILA